MKVPNPEPHRHTPATRGCKGYNTGLHYILYCTVLSLYIPKARERLLVKYGTQATMAGIYLSIDSVDPV